MEEKHGHSGPSLIDPTSNGFFEYIYHIECAMNLHSTINSGLTPGGQNLRKRQTVFFLPVDPMDKNHKDPDTIDLGAPRLAQCMHKAWKKHQNTVYWVDINLAMKKGLKFYQTRSNATILYDTLTAYCISKVVVMESGEIIHEEVYVSPRPPPTISFKDTWMKELGSEVAGSSKDTNESNQTPNYPEPRDPWVNNSSPRRSKKMFCLVAKAPNTQQER